MRFRASIAQRFTGRFTGPSGGRISLSPTEGRVLGPGGQEMGPLQYQFATIGYDLMATIELRLVHT